LAKLKSQTATVSDAEVELESFRDFSEIKTALKAALPDLVCLICRCDTLVVSNMPERGLSPALTFYNRGSGVATEYEPLVSVFCDDCGYVMEFQEQRLFRRAKAKRG
jgi:hypothetical protein